MYILYVNLMISQVAAGMAVKFDVRICAPEVTEISHISLNVDVVMEMEIFHLPVSHILYTSLHLIVDVVFGECSFRSGLHYDGSWESE